MPSELPDRSPLLTGEPAAPDDPAEEAAALVDEYRARGRGPGVVPPVEHVMPWQAARNGREHGAWLLGYFHAVGPFRSDVDAEQLAGATGVLVAAGVTVRQVEHDPIRRRYVLDLS